MTDLGTYLPHMRPQGWRANEQARLYWNGFSQVPRYMHLALVTVQRCSRNSPYIVPLYRVQLGPEFQNEVRTVRADQLVEP